MSVVKEGPLKFYSKAQQWIEVQARLLSNSTLEYTEGNIPTRIEIEPFVSTTRSTRANFEEVFVINNVVETERASGPLFAAEGKVIHYAIFESDLTREKEGKRWMQMINYTCLRNAVALKHAHPLTLSSAVARKPGKSGPSILVLSTSSPITCSACKKKASPKQLFSCEFCEGYNLCDACHTNFSAFESPFITSPNHGHPLMKLPSHKRETSKWGYEGVTFTCAKCQGQCTENGYHCVECDSYSECVKCAGLNAKNNAVQSGDLALDVGLLKPCLKVNGNTFALSTVSLNKCPQAASMIAARHWDVLQIDQAPVPHAYFEVTFNKLAKDGVVGIGVGNQIFVQNDLLGYQQNSFGYLSTGEVSQNVGANVESYPKYGAGDTVGVGLLLDSYNQRRLFFTKNGQLVGTYPERIHRGMDCFPGVSFTKTSGVDFTVNMSGPFQFDVNAVPDYRSDRKDRFEQLPLELLALCLAHASTKPVVAANLALVCKKSAEAAKSNTVWRPLFLQKWPLQTSKLKIKSWFSLYKRRIAYRPSKAVKLDLFSSDIHPIENCEFEFQCPLMWEALQAGQTDGERFCDKCQKTVYQVDNEQTMNEFAELGRCVTFIQKRADPIQGLRGPRMMGSRPAPPRKIPAPFTTK